MKSALAAYWVSGLIVAGAVFFGIDYVGRNRDDPVPPDKNVVAHFANWDGNLYAHIVDDGYDYVPHGFTKIVFFPAFPLLGKLLVLATGLPSRGALLIVAQFFLAASFVLLYFYCRGRMEAEWAILAFAFWPPTFFLRMAYTESLFVFLSLLAMLGIQRRWHPLLIAAVIGAATGTARRRRRPARPLRD